MSFTGTFPSSPFKRHFEVTLGKMLQPAPKSPQDISIPYLRAANIDWSGVRFHDINEMWFSPSELEKYVLNDGDLVVLEGGDVGRAAILLGATGPLGFQNSVHRVRPRHGNDVEFAHFWLQHLKASGYFDLVCSKATLAHFTAEKFAATPFPRIDLANQRKIASFLTLETARIDNLIARKEQLVALLAERGNAAREEILWGNGPVTKLGHHVSVLPGYAFASSNFSDSLGDIRLLRGANVGVDRLRWDDVVFWPRNYLEELERFFLAVGDIVMGMDRPWISGGIRVAQVTEDDLPCLLLQRVCKITPRSTMDRGYLKAVLESRKFLAYFEPILTGVSVPHISGDQISNFRFPFIDFDEQRKRVDSLQRIIGSISPISIATQTSIERLREYRAALITAAVTGQIDAVTYGKSGAVSAAIDKIEEMAAQ